MGAKYVGAIVRRQEDPRYLTRHGRFVYDMSPAGCLHTAVRRRNFIRADEMPYDVGVLYRDGNPLVYDGGDFHATLEAALEASGYRSIRGEQATLRGRGVCRGEPVFEASSYASVPTVTFAPTVHVAVADVDPATGAVKLIRYVVAHDCGRVVNPMLVDGQVHGGVAQGIGGGLYEALSYDETGQLLTGTPMEYHVPAADEVPFIETIHMESHSSRNLLGVKGVGEREAISPPATIANAVEDASSPSASRSPRRP